MEIVWNTLGYNRPIYTHLIWYVPWKIVDLPYPTMIIMLVASSQSHGISAGSGCSAIWSSRAAGRTSMTKKSPVWFGIEPQNIETPKIDQDRKMRNLKLKGNIYSIYIYIHFYTQEHFSTSGLAMQNIQFGMPDCRPSDKHSQCLMCQTIVFLSKIQYFVRIPSSKLT